MRDPKTHYLKIHPEYFREVYQDKKTAEIRYDDRDFMVDDIMVLKEWKPQKKEFSGREIVVKITGMTRLARVIEQVDFHWVVLYFNKENVWYKSIRRIHAEEYTN